MRTPEKMNISTDINQKTSRVLEESQAFTAKSVDELVSMFDCWDEISQELSERFNQIRGQLNLDNKNTIKIAHSEIENISNDLEVTPDELHLRDTLANERLFAQVDQLMSV